MSRWFLSRPIIAFVFFIERWVLSAVFLFLAWEYYDTIKLLILYSETKDLLPASVTARDAGLLDGVHFEDLARYTLLAFSNFACGVLLLISRKPTRYPTRAREILIPLGATFSYSIFNQHVALPAWMTMPFVPDFMATGLAAAGVVISAFGLAMSIVAILWLGRSLGIVVSVREIVLGGPYRWVRHPIYLGYLVIMFGMFLTACTFRMMVLVVGAGALLAWRARLEEGVLSAHSPAYREWMRHTGFLWPRRRTAPARLVVSDEPHEHPAAVR